MSAERTTFASGTCFSVDMPQWQECLLNTAAPAYSSLKARDRSYRDWQPILREKEVIAIQLILMQPKACKV